MLTESEVRAVLSNVIHVSFGMSLITLGMVRAIRVVASAVEIDLVMNCPGCPGGEIALAATRERVRALDGVTEVKLRLLPEPWTPPWEQHW
ncbi:MAG: DUF59 domain-containing protein [Anaerolineae bacterium]|nr:DUF59 domain-containing protein [Anaerolineae bacterium]